VSADYSPKRVVSLQPSATVILAAIGELDRVVACTKYCADLLVWGRVSDPPGRGEAPSPHQPCPHQPSPHQPSPHQPSLHQPNGRIIVADSWTAQSEQILRARPDLVIASVPYQEKAVIEILKSGARFLGFSPKTLADIYADIACIAGIMGVPERGQRVIGEMQQEIIDVRAETDGTARPRVYCEEWGKPLITSQKWGAELVEAAGGEFLGEPGAKRLAQAVLCEDPDIVVVAWCGAGDRVPLEKIVRDRGWGEMRAVKTGRVYCVRDEFLNTPAPTLVYGLKALAAAIHPELFPQPDSLRCIAPCPKSTNEVQPL
jgi:iron complex transport system substrate-binding protein